MKISMRTVSETVKWALCLTPWTIPPLFFGKLWVLDIVFALWMVLDHLRRKYRPVSAYGSGQAVGQLGDTPLLVCDGLVADLQTSPLDYGVADSLVQGLLRVP
jgi:hypothetical protein